MSMEDDTKKCIICGRYNSKICSGCYNDNKGSYNDIRNSVLDEAIKLCDKKLESLGNLTDKRWVNHSHDFTNNLKSALLAMKKETKT